MSGVLLLIVVVVLAALLTKHRKHIAPIVGGAASGLKGMITQGKGKLFYIVLFALACIVIVFGVVFGIIGHPSPEGVLGWSLGHWFWLAIVWLLLLGATYGLEQAARVARQGLYALAGLLVVVGLVAVWGGAFSGPPPGARAQAVTKAPGFQGPWALTLPKLSWPQLFVPAHGTSERIPIPFGTRVLFAGDSRYRIHNVATDGSECINPSPAEHCSGSWGEVYLENVSGEAFSTAWAYAPSDD